MSITLIPVSSTPNVFSICLSSKANSLPRSHFLSSFQRPLYSTNYLSSPVSSTTFSPLNKTILSTVCILPKHHCHSFLFTVKLLKNCCQYFLCVHIPNPLQQGLCLPYSTKMDFVKVTLMLISQWTIFVDFFSAYHIFFSSSLGLHSEPSFYSSILSISLLLLFTYFFPKEFETLPHFLKVII
jgi:hypothetical protein